MANSNTIHIQFTNNCPEVIAAFENAIKRGLLDCGSTAEGYAKDECPVDTGRLRLSITHSMDGDNKVVVGANTEYAIYVEVGTGHYSTLGGGTPKEQWPYLGDDGEWHIGYPQPARPYIKPAIADHENEYMDKIKDSLRNA